LHRGDPQSLFLIMVEYEINLWERHMLIHSSEVRSRYGLLL
jgi:hypothetical protein